MFIRHVILSVVAVLLCATTAFSAEPIIVAEGIAPLLPQQPQLALGDDGSIHLVYGVQNDTFYTRSTDGKSFSKPVKLPSVNVMSLGMRRGPRIAVTKKNICVTVIGGKQGKGRDGDLLAFHSTDNGQAWSDPAAVNDAPDAAREGLHGMAAGPNGELACIWLDLRNKATEVYASRSSNGGQTWTKDVLVYRSPDGSVCECCHPSIVYDAKGRMIAMWRNSLDGQRDMYFAVAGQGAAEFGEASKLGSGSWNLDHCPMDGGAMAMLKDGTLATVWRRDKTLFTAIERQPEAKLAAGEQPVLAATSRGLATAWITKRGGDLMLEMPGLRPQKVALDAYDPVIVSTVKADDVILAWEAREGSTGRIYCRIGR